MFADDNNDPWLACVATAPYLVEQDPIKISCFSSEIVCCQFLLIIFFFNRANIICSLCSDLRAVNQCSHRSNKLPEFTVLNGLDYYEKIFYADPVA